MICEDPILLKNKENAQYVLILNEIKCDLKSVYHFKFEIRLIYKQIKPSFAIRLIQNLPMTTTSL